MPLTEEMKRIYASAPNGADFIIYECISVSHSAFTEGVYHFVRNRVTPMDKLFEGDMTTFQPLYFEFKLPTRNGSGVVDMEIQIPNLDRGLIEQIELAVNAPKEPIYVKFSLYTEGSEDPQMDPPIALTLANVAVNASSIVGTASRADVLNRAFPRLIFRPSGADSYPGLDR